MRLHSFHEMDIYQQHEQGGEESFWPSFTDIMMVIVMTFLLIAVAVILNNWQLVNNLKASMLAERQASLQAQSALQNLQTKEMENETLEQRMMRLEALVAQKSSELQLSQKNLQESQTLLNQTQQELSSDKQQIQSLSGTVNQLSDNLKSKDQALSTVQQALETKNTELRNSLANIEELENQQRKNSELLEDNQKTIQGLRDEAKKGYEQLASLQGEFDELDTKYQKLLRPARSEKGKYVVKVMFTRVGGKRAYRLQEPGGSYKDYSRRNLNKALGRLKKKQGENLYVKIIIPDSSGLSHSDAWKFTKEILNSYDYYYDGENQL